MDSTPQRPVWTTGTLARGAWQDSSVFGLPHATYFNAVRMHHLMLLVILKEVQYTLNMKKERMKH